MEQINGLSLLKFVKWINSDNRTRWLYKIALVRVVRSVEGDSPTPGDVRFSAVDLQSLLLGSTFSVL